jgi:tripartite ATP-independent transporter DctP family solute receptor
MALSRRNLLISGAAVTVGAGSVLPKGVMAQQAQQFTFRVAHYFKADHPWNIALTEFAKKLKDDSKGRIQLDIFGAGILGSEAQTLQFVKDGSLDMVVAAPSAGAPFAKEFDFFGMPFIFRDYAHWQEAMNGAPGKTYAKLIEDRTGIKILGYWGGSTRNVMSAKKPVLSIDDMKGFRIRVMASQLNVDVWKAVGAVPTPVAYTETYLAIKSGVVDGMENESASALDMKFYEAAPYFARTEHDFTVRPLFMAKKSFEALPADLQQIVLKDAQDVTVYERKIENEARLAAEAEMQGKFNAKFNAIDKKPFQAATAPVVAEFAKSLGLSDLLQNVKAMA